MWSVTRNWAAHARMAASRDAGDCTVFCAAEQGPSAGVPCDLDTDRTAARFGRQRAPSCKSVERLIQLLSSRKRDERACERFRVIEDHLRLSRILAGRSLPPLQRGHRCSVPSVRGEPDAVIAGVGGAKCAREVPGTPTVPAPSAPPTASRHQRADVARTIECGHRPHRASHCLRRQRPAPSLPPTPMVCCPPLVLS